MKLPTIAQENIGKPILGSWETTWNQSFSHVYGWNNHIFIHHKYKTVSRTCRKIIFPTFQFGGFLKWGIPKSPWLFQYIGHPHDFGNLQLKIFENLRKLGIGCGSGQWMFSHQNMVIASDPSQIVPENCPCESCNIPLSHLMNSWLIVVPPICYPNPQSIR